VSLLIPVQTGIMTVGAWTDKAGAVAGSYAKTVTAAANSPVFAIPLNPIQNSVALKGSYLKSIDVVYIIGTAAMTTVTMAINQETLPANAGAYPAKVNPAFTYDSNHTTNANRVTQTQHTLTMTVTAPYWLANTEQDFLEIDLVNPGTAVFDLYAVRINCTLRI
jgi:hypothetical protein